MTEQQRPVYLDDNGEPIVYLDDQGNPISTPEPMSSHAPTDEPSTHGLGPTIGGAIGGLAGGSKVSPVGIGLAGLGGAAGQGVTEVANAASDPVREASSGWDAVQQANAPLLRMAQAGAEQAGMEGIGRGVGGMMRIGARGLYGGLLKPAKALKEGFGGGKAISGNLLDNRVSIGDSGLRKITGRMAGSRGKALDMVGAAEDAGMRPVVAHEVIREFRPVVKELRKRADIGQTDELAKVGARGKAIVRTADRQVGIPLRRAQELKETAQDAASGAYRQKERGTTKQLSADDMLDDATAKGLRKGIEDRVPDVAAQNKITQKHIGGTRAVEDAIERDNNTLAIGGAKDLWALAGATGGYYAGGDSGDALKAGILARLLATPRTGSLAAIGLNEAGRGTKVALPQLLRLLMASHDPQD